MVFFVMNDNILKNKFKYSCLKKKITNIYLLSPDLENNSTCWDFKNNAKGGK